MMRSKSKPAKGKGEGKGKESKAQANPASPLKPKPNKDKTEKKSPLTIRIELSQGGKVLHEETRSLPAKLDEQVVSLVKEKTLDRVALTALLLHLQKKKQTGTLATAPNGNIFAKFGKGKKREVLLVNAGNDYSLLSAGHLVGLLVFGTDEQQSHIVELAQASRE
jgi:hypothetical protein